jgi:hypothetical protein
MQRRTVWLILGGVLLVVACALVASWSPLQHWLAVHTGTIDEGGVYYGFWSGFGADLGEVTLITTVGLGVYTGVRRANCHVKGCWRIGHHPLEGTPYHLCARHHPDVPTDGATHAEILEHHHRLREAAHLRDPSEPAQRADAAPGPATSTAATSPADGGSSPPT